jgi:hypothetical protein
MPRLALLVPLLALAAQPAVALDLTGTWEGKFKCSVFDGATEKFTQPGEILRITQQGDDLNVEWAGVADLTGLAIADVKSPDTKGAAALADCETSADLENGPYSEIAVLSAKINRAKAKGSLKGTSIWSPDADAVGDCKWKFKLVDASDPGALGCPVAK